MYDELMVPIALMMFDIGTCYFHLINTVKLVLSNNLYCR
jgi:hypothetical protein